MHSLGFTPWAKMSRISTTSSTTLRTDVSSKVLPGDKSGLPLEIWQMIFSYLSVRDLCCVARVSKTWYDLSLSIDMTRWKELYLACPEWRHPYWPLNIHQDPPSWKTAYRNQHLSTCFWNRLSHQAYRAGCITLLKRTRERHTIEVGPGKQYETLKSAFAVAGEYDRVLVHPGIYDEQLEMSVKAPFELVGVGELGSVILVVCMELLSSTGRLSNLVLRAPWFTNFILRVKTGYLQIDNCIMEDGMMCVANPASCHIQFCTFRHATVVLQHINAAIIRNCEFSQSDNANIVVEGYPKDEKNWAYPHLCQQMDAAFTHRHHQGHRHLLKATDSTTSTLHSTFTFTSKSFATSSLQTYDTVSRTREMADSSTVGPNINGFGHGPGIVGSGVSNGEHILKKPNLFPGKSTENGAGSFAEGGENGAMNANSSGLRATCVSLPPVNKSDTAADSGKNEAEAQKLSISSVHVASKQCVGGVSASSAVSKGGAGEMRSQAEEAESSGLAQAQQTRPGEEGEWLEIHDERKAWQLEGERRMDRTLLEGCLCTGEGASVKDPCPKCAAARHKLSSNKQWAWTELEPASCDEAGRSGADICSPDSAADHRSLPFAGDSTKHGSEAQRRTLEGVRGASCDLKETKHSQCQEEQAQALDKDREMFFNGDVYPQNLPPLNSSSSRLFQHQHHHPQHGQPLPGAQSQAAQPQPDPGSQQAASSLQCHPSSQSPRPLDALPVGDGEEEGLHRRGEEEEEGGGDRMSQRSFHSSRSRSHSRGSSSDDDDLSILNDLESAGSGSGGSNHGSSSSSEDSQVEGFFQVDSEYDGSDPEESVVMLPHLRQKHIEASLSANAVNADVDSIYSQASRPILLSATQDQGVLSHVSRVRGCLIHQCRLMHSKGGVMVSLQAHAVISACHISNLSYGVRCIQNARVVVLKNRIHHCRTSGIFMRLAASGLIAGNDIHSNNEAGVDIRKNADPVVQHNRIHHGKRSGVVVLGSGRGQICSNSIYSNNEAGIYILYGGNPIISENHIFDGKAAGVAVNEGGQGFIFDNTITSNQWGGVDIRRGSCPMVCRNTITNGLGDGIVIGEHGQGTIENNIISDNAGCGLWLMSASRPYIHGNQISNNGDTGVMMVNKTDVRHEGSHLLPVGNVHHAARTHSVLGGLGEDWPTPQPKCSHTTLQHNNIYHNAGRGVAVELGAKVDVMYNAIYGNQRGGVWVSQEAPLVLQGNSVCSNLGHGIVTALTSQMDIKENGIYDNSDWGIVCSGMTQISENDIVCNQAGGIIVDSNASTKITSNRIQAPSGPAVKVTATIKECVVNGNNLYYSVTGELLDLSQQAVVVDNQITSPPPGHDRLPHSRHKSSREPAFNKSYFLRNPPPRPAIQPPPPPSDLPHLYGNPVTKVTVPSSDTCQNGSKLCIIL